MYVKVIADVVKMVDVALITTGGEICEGAFQNQFILEGINSAEWLAPVANHWEAMATPSRENVTKLGRTWTIHTSKMKTIAQTTNGDDWVCRLELVEYKSGTKAICVHIFGINDETVVKARQTMFKSILKLCKPRISVVFRSGVAFNVSEQIAPRGLRGSDGSIHVLTYDHTCEHPSTDPVQTEGMDISHLKLDDIISGIRRGEYGRKIPTTPDIEMLRGRPLTQKDMDDSRKLAEVKEKLGIEFLTLVKSPNAAPMEEPSLPKGPSIEAMFDLYAGPLLKIKEALGLTDGTSYYGQSNTVIGATYPRVDVDTMLSCIKDLNLYKGLTHCYRLDIKSENVFLGCIAVYPNVLNETGRLDDRLHVQLTRKLEWVSDALWSELTHKLHHILVD